MHATVVGMHALCCGIPAALAISGAAVGVLAWASGPVTAVHRFLHGYEPEILALSFTLVAVGGFWEWRRHKFKQGVPALYALSVACLAANIAIIAAHRLPLGG
jgi:hypothetical protein